MDSKTREYPVRREDLAGIRSLLERHCRNAAVAEDLLGEAIETSLRKLRDGELAEPDKLAGYIYRVALNLLRNLRRSQQAHPSSSAGLEGLEADGSHSSESLDRAHWARIMKEVLAGLDTPRDRELIAAFYLQEEDKDSLCRRLGLSAQHFNRVIHRARERFRELLEQRGFKRGDFLGFMLAVVG